MAYTIGCQGCRKRYRVHSQALGRTVSCPVCRMPIAVPDPRLFGSRWSRGALTLPVAEPVEDGSFAGDAPMATQVKPGGSLRPPPLPMRPRADVAELPPDSGLLELLDDNGLLGTLLLAPRLGRMGRWLDWLEWSLRRELDFFPEGQGVVRFVASNKLACTAGALGLGLGLFELVSQGSWWGPVLAGLGLALAYRGSRWEWAMARKLRLLLWFFIIGSLGLMGRRHGHWEQWWREATAVSRQFASSPAEPETPLAYRSLVAAEPAAVPTPLESPPGIRAFEVRLEPPAGQRRSERLWVYLPAAAPPDRSLTCVLAPASGSEPGFGARLSPAQRGEYLAYARAGLAVVAFEIDGAAPAGVAAGRAEVRAAFAEFRASLAGLCNAHDAFEYAAKHLQQVDPARIVVAGHGLAGTLALLLAEHEPGLKACILYAAPTRLVAADMDALSSAGAAAEFLSDASPENHLPLVRAPVFIFHALDDNVVPPQTSDNLRKALLRLNRHPRLVTIPQGGHYEATVSRGIYEAIIWLRSQNLAPAATAEPALQGNAAVLAEPAVNTSEPPAPPVPAADQARGGTAPALAPGPAEPAARDLDRSPAAPPLGRAPREVLDLERRAERAFLRRHDPRAGFRLLSAAALLSDEARLWPSFGWNAALGKALPALRWGVGMLPAPGGPGGRPAESLQGTESTRDTTRAAPPDNGWPGNQAARAAAMFRQLDEVGPVGAAVVQVLQSGLEAGRFGEKSWVGAHPVGTLRGLAMVGSGTLGQLVAEARALDLDVLVVFEMKETPLGDTAQTAVDPSVAVHVLEVTRRDELWTSEWIRRSDVIAARNAASSPITRLSETFGDFVAGRCTLEPLASADRDAVQRRVESIERDKRPAPLGTLAELKLYRQRQWISAAQFESAVVELLGQVQATSLLRNDLPEMIEWIEREMAAP